MLIDGPFGKAQGDPQESVKPGYLINETDQQRFNIGRDSVI
jgi:hypothetical protein